MRIYWEKRTGEHLLGKEDFFIHVHIVAVSIISYFVGCL